MARTPGWGVSRNHSLDLHSLIAGNAISGAPERRIAGPHHAHPAQRREVGEREAQRLGHLFPLPFPSLQGYSAMGSARPEDTDLDGAMGLGQSDAFQLSNPPERTGLTSSTDQNLADASVSFSVKGPRI